MKKRFNFVASPQTSSIKSDEHDAIGQTLPAQQEKISITRANKQVGSLLVEARKTIISALASRFGIPAQDLLSLLGNKLFEDTLTGVEIGSVLARGFRKTRRVLDIDLHKVIRDLSLVKTIIPTIKDDRRHNLSLVPDVAEDWESDIVSLLKKIGDIGSDKFIKTLIVDFIKNSTGTEDLEQASFGQFYFGICLLEQSLMPIPGNPRGFLHLLSEKHRNEAEKRRSQILSVISATRQAALQLVSP
jgi:hypothetical protein